MKFNSIAQYTACLAIAAAIAACGSTANDADTVEGSDSMSVIDQKLKDTKAQNVFYSIPSPIETTSLLKSAGAKYNSKFLNPIENVSKYSSVTSKALNLGVYGSDLSFTSIFDQTQESLLYLRCTNKLAAGLGISGAFDESTTTRIESNMDNRDSLLGIISDSYWSADSYLKENGQPGVSSLIVAGGWIEGLYIATQIANTTKNDAIITRIGEQKLSLENLLALLESYKAENAGIADVITSLNGLKAIYDEMPATAGETKVATDTATKVTTIGNDASFKLTPEQLKRITDKTTEIRNKIIQ